MIRKSNLSRTNQAHLTYLSTSGTPNSSTTSMSELSTVAIKDGHRGHLHHHSHAPLDAERADRISRLAGLDRVAQPRGHAPAPTSTAGDSTPQRPVVHAYFDANNQPQMMRERSTVGSASATGSVGGRTTWASGSNDDGDKMSEDMEVDTSSMGGFSDEGTASLVGFGEGARTPARQLSSIGSPVPGTKAPQGLRLAQTQQEKQDARMIDGMTYDKDVVDTANRTPPPVDE
jgi:hypothetical protein